MTSFFDTYISKKQLLAVGLFILFLLLATLTTLVDWANPTPTSCEGNQDCASYYNQTEPY